MNVGSLSLQELKLLAMPHMNGMGQEGKGSGTGRNLGNCKNSDPVINEKALIGKGQGKRRNSDEGNGKGKRLKYNQNQ
jgi:hypothetical protein